LGGRQKYIKYKINYNSENFRGARLLPGGFAPWLHLVAGLAYVLSGWATMTGRLLCPKMDGFKCPSQRYKDVLSHRESN